MSPRTAKQNNQIRQQARKQIIDAAFELFANEGYTQTSISAVAKKAGISKGLIYHYFDSKEAILEAIFDQLVQVGDQILDFPEGFTAADKIKQTLERTFQFIEEETGVGKLMISLALQPDAFNTLKAKVDEVNKTQTVLYIEIFRELGYDQPKVEAYRLGALMDGLLLAYAAMDEDYPYLEIKQKILEEYVPDEDD
jgi:AcrR family transcriptional regulator